ncbi:ZapG family protein [Vreelandella olivaria]|uniref:ZapG family protein n=1 Tax=Vreelandella olivaria TaxID=390919 RepID=UPI00201E7C5B
MEANSPFTFAIVGIIIGFILGMACYRLFSKGERKSTALRQTLLEREHQIAELKKAMGSHITDVRQRLENIRAEADQLEQQLEEDTAQWRLGKIAVTGSITPSITDIDHTLTTPRDYADGKGGTLSEDFGLKESAKEKDASTPQPPRY